MGQMARALLEYEIARDSWSGSREVLSTHRQTAHYYNTLPKLEVEGAMTCASTAFKMLKVLPILATGT